LKSVARGEKSTTIGHNPAGGFSVIVMLVLLLGQGVTGLFTNDDIMLEGPLTHLVSYRQSRSLTGIHETISWLLIAVISVHVLAILFYRVVKKENLVKAMITGSVEVAKPIATSSKRPDQKGTTIIDRLDPENKQEGNYRLRGVLLLGLSTALIYGVINYL